MAQGGKKTKDKKTGKETQIWLIILIKNPYWSLSYWVLKLRRLSNQLFSSFPSPLFTNLPTYNFGFN